MTLLDQWPVELIEVVRERIETKERGGVKREASLHRWWSKRFVYMYRAILASFLMSEYDRETFERAIDRPETLDAGGKVYLEPMAGGGTGVIEASLYNYTAYGIDVNPLAYSIIKGYSVLRKGVDLDRISAVIEKVKVKLSSVLQYKGKTVSYVLITRGKVPSWIYTRKGKKVVLCPKCGTTFETDEKESARCPHCKYEVKITIKPTFDPPKAVPYFGPWKAFGIIYGDREFAFDEEWLRSRASSLSDVKLPFEFNLIRLKEGERLIRAGIRSPSQLFTPAQLATFVEIAEASKELDERERLILSLVTSDSVRTCTVLAKWYPPLTEPVIYAGGVKGFWVPEYTAEANPLEKARGSIAYNLKNVRRIMKYDFRGEIIPIYGNALDVDFPKSDLIVIDPPYYGMSIDYASLSFPHYAIWRLFDGKYSIDDALKGEIKAEDYFHALERVLAKTKDSLKKNGRAVLIINMKRGWERLLEVIDNSRLSVVNEYEMLGESPGKLGRSLARSIKVVVLSKK